MARENFTQGTFTLRIGITIPANNGTIQTLAALIKAGSIDTTGQVAALWSPNAIGTIDDILLSKVVGVRIHKYAPGTNSGAQRSAFMVSNGTSGSPSNSAYVATGEDWMPPAVREMVGSFPMSTNTTPISALVELTVMATPGAA